MKTIFRTTLLAVLLVASSGPCFALWDVETVSRERAKELGIEVRSQRAGPNHRSVELEFHAKGELKGYTGDASSSDPGWVELRIGEGENLLVSATLREDRPKPDRIAVRFSVNDSQLEQLTLRVMVPFRDGGAGGTVYDLRVKDLVEVNKDR